MSETLSGAVRQKEVLADCSNSRTARFPTALVETEMIDSDPTLFWYSSCARTRFEHRILNSFTSTERAGSVDICHIYIEMSTPQHVCVAAAYWKKMFTEPFQRTKDPFSPGPRRLEVLSLKALKKNSCCHSESDDVAAVFFRKLSESDSNVRRKEK